MSEFYRLPRGLSNHPVFRRDEEPYCHIGAWVWLFDHAVVRDQTVRLDGKPVLLRRGQLAHTTRSMAAAWGWSETSVRRFLQDCVEGGEIKRERGAKSGVITLCNYEDYSFYDKHRGAISEAPCNIFASGSADLAPFNEDTAINVNGTPNAGAIPAQSRRKDGAVTNCATLREVPDNSHHTGETGAIPAQSWRDVGAVTDSYASSDVGFAPSNGDFGNHRNGNPQCGAMLAQSWRKVGAATSVSPLGESADNSFRSGERGAIPAQCWDDAGAVMEKDAIDALFLTADDAIGALWPDDSVVDVDCYGALSDCGETQDCCDYSFRIGERGAVSRVQGTYLSTVRTVRKKESKEESKEEKKENYVKEQKEILDEIQFTNRTAPSHNGEARQEARPSAALTQPAAAGLKNEIEGQQGKKLHPMMATVQPELFTPQAVVSVPPVDVVKLVKPKSQPKAAPLKAGTDPQFQEFWKAYPKKADQALAYAAYKTALRDGATHAELLAGIASYSWPEYQFRVRAHFWLADKQWLPSQQKRLPPAERAPRGPMSMREAGIRFYGGSL